jgi:hypothetical protein
VAIADLALGLRRGSAYCLVAVEMQRFDKSRYVAAALELLHIRST